MKDDSLSLSESIQAFARELALSLRRIAGRAIKPDPLPIVQPKEVVVEEVNPPSPGTSNE